VVVAPEEEKEEEGEVSLGVNENRNDVGENHY
jgi:hypothetical protein